MKTKAQNWAGTASTLSFALSGAVIAWTLYMVISRGAWKASANGWVGLGLLFFVALPGLVAASASAVAVRFIASERVRLAAIFLVALAFTIVSAAGILGAFAVQRGGG